ncbi:MAG TPA: amidohydrolase [Candidatus Dorea intestinavium]|nr:amidohydrolase [Candidatus Dorea intestinavium]
MSLVNEAKTYLEEIREHRRYIHEHAEVGFELEKTRQYISQSLKEMGYEPKEVGGGIIALVGGKKPGKTILIRGDMDALPIKEDAKVKYAAKTGNMHACGHDFHAAMLLGAARLLKNHEEEIEGQIKLMFQPAEELLKGAKSMIEAGLMENPQVDSAMMIHVMIGSPYETGKLLVQQPGIGSSAADWYEIHIQGKGCHGAMPNTGLDPLNVAAHILIALQEIHARGIPTGSSLALTVGQLHGGSVSNVVPDTAYLTGTIRTLDPQVREFAKERMVEITENVAKAFRCSAEVKFTTECPSVISDEKMVHQVIEYAKEIAGTKEVIDTKNLPGLFLAGSEDFALLAEMVPAAFMALSAGSTKEGYSYPLHHPKAVFNEEALPIGAALYAGCAMKWLLDNK